LYNIVQYFDYFITRARLSWFNHNPVVVKSFSYNLSQYTPSVYAEILLMINADYFEDFKNIEKLPIKDRIVEVWFEDELYSLKHNNKFFSGPFRFCVINYEVTKFQITEMDIEYSDINSGKLISLKCVDPVFYVMQLDEKYESYGKTTISEIVNKLVSRNGGKVNRIEPTSYSYNWLQAQLTDYEMIRSLLPYAKSTSGDLLYTFFMFNEEAYFAPITQSLKTPYTVKLDMIKNSKEIVYSTDFKSLIEKYGSKEHLLHFNRGYNDFKSFTPDSMTRQSYLNSKSSIRKQHKGFASQYITGSIDEEELQKIYISNLRHRVYTFGKLVDTFAEIIPELTPLNCLEIISQEDGKTKDLDGLYYIASVTYNYGMTNVHPYQPYMHMVLCSELDSEGMESPEGGPITSGI